LCRLDGLGFDRWSRDERAHAKSTAPAAARDRAEARTGATIALPLIIARGGVEEALGALAITFADDAAADAADPTYIRLVGDLVALAVDRARLASTIAERSEWFERLAHTDPLTGLANLRTASRVLELELARAARQNGEVSVAVFDIDDFAAINASAGRDGGDDLLRSVAAVLSGSVRLVDTVARYGADAFLLVAPGSAGALVAQRVLDGVAELAASDGRTIGVTAGVARFPADGTDADSVLAAAQAALERARRERRAIVETNDAG